VDQDRDDVLASSELPEAEHAPLRLQPQQFLVEVQPQNVAQLALPCQRTVAGAVQVIESFGEQQDGSVGAHTAQRGQRASRALLRLQVDDGRDTVCTPRPFVTGRVLRVARELMLAGSALISRPASHVALTRTDPRLRGWRLAEDDQHWAAGFCSGFR
jgi:hypothetical protein